MLKRTLVICGLGMAVMAPSAFSVTLLAPSAETPSAVQNVVDTLSNLNAKETTCTKRDRSKCEDTVRRYHVSADGCVLTIGEAERTYSRSAGVPAKYAKHTYEIDLARVDTHAGTYSDYYRKWHAVWLKQSTVNVSNAGGRTQWIMRFPGYRTAAKPAKLKSVIDVAIAECKSAGQAETS